MNAQLQQLIQSAPFPDINMVDKILAEQDLLEFIKQGWHVLERKSNFKSGWHIEAICEHLMALYNGDIKDLVINIPPRHMKSLSCCVFFPAWIWIQEPAFRFLFTSYAETLSTRDSLKCRRVIQSPWYQANWGDRYHLTSDQNAKQRFENSEMGYRLSTTVDGKNTGEGGDGICVDDANNVKKAESDLIRIGTNIWWDETMSSRLNDPETGWTLIIQQRTHEGDLTGHVLEKDLGFTHLCLPARYEGKKLLTKIPMDAPRQDPRTEIDEPLWKEHYPEEALTNLENKMGEYARAGQLQQRPAPRGGGMFPTAKFRVVNGFDSKIVASVRYWDKAATEDGGCYTAGVLFHKLEDGTYIVTDVVRGQWEYGKRERYIRQTAELDGKKVHVWIEQEPGSGGKESAEATIKNMAGFRVYAERVTGAKEVRAEPYAIQVEHGNILILNRDWTKAYIKEHEKYPLSKYKDQVDAGGGAFNKVSARRKRAGTW